MTYGNFKIVRVFARHEEVAFKRYGKGIGTRVQRLAVSVEQRALAYRSKSKSILIFFQRDLSVSRRKLVDSYRLTGAVIYERLRIVGERGIRNFGACKNNGGLGGDVVFRYRYHGIFSVSHIRRRNDISVHQNAGYGLTVARDEHQIARARAYRKIRNHGDGFAVHNGFYFCFDLGHVHRGAESHAAFVGEIPAVSVHMAYLRGSHVTTVSHKRYRVCALITRLGTGKSVYQAVESYGFNAAADYGYGCGMHAFAT